MIILASSSPRRSALLEQIGVAHEVIAPDVDETQLPGEVFEEYVLRLALDKARAVQLGQPGRLVLAADTAVTLGDRLLGKPRDRDDALVMLARLSGRTHFVYTGVVLLDETGSKDARLSISAVSLRAISPAEAAAYWDTGEPQDKAGGYAIQGQGAIFVAHLAGSYSGVMGLPLFETASLLTEKRELWSEAAQNRG
jgi:septum formation protein